MMKIINKHEEDEMETWHDYKISGRDVRFPQHEDKEPSLVITYSVEELNKIS
jgi:hypothetical protein